MFVDIFWFLFTFSVSLNIFLVLKNFVIDFIRKHSTPHVLAVYGTTDFDKEAMLQSLYDSGINHTFIDSGLDKEYLIRCLENPTINIFELSAHGNSKGFYLFDEFFSFSWLRHLLRHSNIKLVLLLSCGSHAYENIIDSAHVVVSLTGDVEDATVINYTKELYRLLALRKGFKESALRAKKILNESEFHKIQVRSNPNYHDYK